MYNDFIIKILDSNWSIWPLVIAYGIWSLEYYHRSDISALISRINFVKWGERQFGFDGKQGDIKKEENRGSKNDITDIQNKYTFEIIYNNCFRSQFLMMQELKEKNNILMPYQHALNYLFAHRAFNPIADEHAYFDWMIHADLVQRDEKSCFVLTPYGMK